MGNSHGKIYPGGLEADYIHTLNETVVGYLKYTQSVFVYSEPVNPETEQSLRRAYQEALCRAKAYASTDKRYAWHLNHAKEVFAMEHRRYVNRVLRKN